MLYIRGCLFVLTPTEVSGGNSDALDTYVDDYSAFGYSRRAANFDELSSAAFVDSVVAPLGISCPLGGLIMWQMGLLGMIDA